MSERMPSFEDVSKEPQKFMSEGEINESGKRETRDIHNNRYVENRKNYTTEKIYQLIKFAEENENALALEIAHLDVNDSPDQYDTESGSKKWDVELERVKKLKYAMHEFKEALKSLE